MSDGENLPRINRADPTGYLMVALSLQQKELFRLAIMILDAGIERCGQAGMCLDVGDFEIARPEVRFLLRKHPTDKVVKLLSLTIESLAKQAEKSATDTDGNPIP